MIISQTDACHSHYAVTATVERRQTEERKELWRASYVLDKMAQDAKWNQHLRIRMDSLKLNKAESFSYSCIFLAGDR